MDGTSKDKSDEVSYSAEAIKDPAIKYRIGLLLLLAVFFIVFIASFGMGRLPISPSDVLLFIFLKLQSTIHFIISSIESVFSGQPATQMVMPDTIDSSAWTIFWNVRFPRVACAALVGAALSIAGASYQGLFQNPMVSQDILGASSGAAAGAAIAIFFSLGVVGITTLSFAFGLLAVFAAYMISKVSRVNTILAMILAGMVISALFSSGVSFIKLIADTENTLPAITYWLMGSLASIRTNDLVFASCLIIPALIPIILLRWRINLLATGEEEARSMGLNVQHMRVLIIACATLLTATCVAISGVIGWVGLIIPLFCRLLFGYDYRRIITASILMGASFLLLVDDFARLAATSEIPIGILTAFVGAPIFIFLILKGGVRSANKDT